ncbi:MAG: hypothetical protein AB7I41_10465 [Candidatus Sericytochromatia bacterium]
MIKNRLTALFKALSNGCPRCGHRPIARLTRFESTCPQCQLVLDRGNGFLLSAIPISYALFVLFWLIPLMVAWILKQISYPMAFGLVAFGAVFWPLVLYNYCKMMSLSLYYFFMAHELEPAESAPQ